LYLTRVRPSRADTRNNRAPQGAKGSSGPAARGGSADGNSNGGRKDRTSHSSQSPPVSRDFSGSLGSRNNFSCHLAEKAIVRRPFLRGFRSTLAEGPRGREGVEKGGGSFPFRGGRRNIPTHPDSSGTNCLYRDEELRASPDQTVDGPTLVESLLKIYIAAESSTPAPRLRPPQLSFQPALSLFSAAFSAASLARVGRTSGARRR
jgi:hypothetical protein